MTLLYSVSEEIIRLGQITQIYLLYCDDERRLGQKSSFYYVDEEIIRLGQMTLLYCVVEDMRRLGQRT